MKAKDLISVIVVAGLLLTGAEHASATIHNVDIQNFSFSPAGTVVSPGDTVRWTLQMGTHTTTSDATSPKIWDSGPMNIIGQTFDVVFMAADGPGPFPYHCNFHPAAMKDTIFMAPLGTSPQDVADYIRDNILGGEYDSVTMWMTDTWLDSTHVARDIGSARQDIPFPYERTWLVMIDDNPDANWGHSVRWVFVDDDLTQHSVVGIRDFPPAAVSDFGTGPLLSFYCREVTPYPCPVLTPPPSTGDGGGDDKDCLYAVLISGGWNNGSNYSRYPENLASMYNILRGCGYPKANIFVYYANGTKPLDLDNADGDGIHATGNDVTAGAVEALIRAKISDLCDNLNPETDVLFIYVTNHGESGGCAVLWDHNMNGSMDANEKYCPSELAADTWECKVCRLFQIHDQCYSGAFVDEVSASADHANTVVYSAATAAEPSWGREYMDIWEDNDPSAMTINDMHNDVVTTTISSTPEMVEKTAGFGGVSPCKCWEPCASGSCDVNFTATFLPPGTGTWPLTVEFVPPDPVSPTVRMAPVDAFTLMDPALGLLITSPWSTSKFYLISQQPGGDPFFPAQVVGSLFVKAYLPDFGLQLHNTEAMVIQSENTYMQWPPELGEIMTFMSIGRTHLVSNFTRQPDTLTIESSFATLTNLQSPSCCIDIRGNVDGDVGDQVNVADLTYLVDYLFRGGPPPPCWEEGNVNGDPAEDVNIADLTYIVDYLFRGGPPPPPCP